MDYIIYKIVEGKAELFAYANDEEHAQELVEAIHEMNLKAKVYSTITGETIIY